MEEQILKLREEGKTYNEIVKILGCSKGTVSYHCGEGQKEKAKDRGRRNRAGIYKPKKAKTLCIVCGGSKKRSTYKYCSNKCQQEFKYLENIKSWKEGGNKGYTGKTKALASWIRRYLFESRGTNCSKCGWGEKHPVDDKPLVEINHIDGDAENNKEDNLEILCPNCHSKTPNFRNRNKKSKRIRN